jgi:hypothetical protein
MWKERKLWAGGWLTPGARAYGGKSTEDHQHTVLSLSSDPGRGELVAEEGLGQFRGSDAPIVPSLDLL